MISKGILREGEHFFHVPGALLAVPCMSIAQSVFLHVETSMRASPPPPLSGIQ